MLAPGEMSDFDECTGACVASTSAILVNWSLMSNCLCQLVVRVSSPSQATSEAPFNGLGPEDAGRI
jgi:hypothetical protein